MARDDIEQQRALRGALFVGSQQQVIDKILFQHEVFRHDRFLLQVSVGTLPHARVMRAIELFGTIVAGAALPFVWEPVATADLWKFGLIACLGTGAQLCIIRSFSITEAGIVAPFAYLGIVFAAFWGVVLFDQWPDRWTVIGALVIVGAGLYVWHRETLGARAAAS